jgi:CubicO group peptidase (beta-lactamase class C family)
LGYFIEVVSGMPLDQFMEERLFKPLGMNDTGFVIPAGKRDRLAETYTPRENGGIKVEGQEDNIFSGGQPTLFLGGEGLVSTASDYMRFAQMILNKGELDGVRVLSPKTVELMSLNHLSEGMVIKTPDGSDPSGWGFGLGFAVRKDVAKSQLVGSVGELTWGGAASTYFWIDPKEELIGLMMTQFAPTFLYPVWQQLKVLTYQAIID